jgi:hypothetical protein
MDECGVSLINIHVCSISGLFEGKGKVSIAPFQEDIL